MGRVILDTSVLVGMERTGRPLAGLIREDDDVAVAAVSIAEMRVGAELAGEKQRPRRLAFIESIVRTLDVEPYDLTTTQAHADLMVHARRSGRQRGNHDLMIAATGIARSRTVVTLDARGFEGLPGLAVRAP